MKNTPNVTHSVEIDIVETDRMFLREAIGDGEINGHKFTLDTVIPNGSLCVRFGNKQFILQSRDFVQAAAELLEKAK